jgi:hypothetical protein
MLIPFSPEWRAMRERRRKATAFLDTAQREPDDGDVRWLAEAAANHDVDHARWELRYARLVLAVLAAERDALDDRTGSEVVAALAERLGNDPRVAPGMLQLVRRQLNDRLSAYREALTSGGGAAGSGEKLGRVLLAFASDASRTAGAPLERAVTLLTGYLSEANDSLRAIYGTASLPDHLPPSEIAAASGR